MKGPHVLVARAITAPHRGIVLEVQPDVDVELEGTETLPFGTWTKVCHFPMRQADVEPLAALPRT